MKAKNVNTDALPYFQLYSFVDIFSVCIIDKNHRIIEADKRTAEVTGKSKEELKGAFCCQIFHNSETPPPHCPLETIKKIGERSSYFMPFEAFGKTFFVEVSDFPGKEGEQFIHIAYDVSYLLDREELFHLIFSKYTHSVMVLSEEWEIKECNKAFYNLMGYDEEEIINHKLEKSGIIPDETIKKLKSISQESYQFESPIHLKRKDGKTLLCELEIIKVKGKKFRGRVIAFKDVTEKEEIKTQLQYSEEKFRKAFHINPDSININRMVDGKYVDINEGFTQIMGFTREDVIGKSSLELNIWVHEEDRQKLVTLLKENGEVLNFEADFRAKNGDIKRGLMSARILMIQGDPHILSVTKDITENYRMKRQMENQLALLKQASNMAKLGYVEWEPNKNQLVISDEFVSICKDDEVRNITHLNEFVKFVHDDDKSLFDKFLNDALKGKTQAGIRFRILRGHSIGWVQAKLEILTNNHESHKRILFVIQDITEDIEREKELENYRNHLEKLVKERTKELEDRNEMLERLNKVFVGREFRIKELRTKVEKLKKELDKYRDENSSENFIDF